MNSKIFLGLICGAALMMAVVQAQTGVAPVANGSEAVGTIKEISPGVRLVLQTITAPDPIKFKLSKTTTYADSSGKPMEASGLAANHKVRVHYTKTDADNVADKITMVEE